VSQAILTALRALDVGNDNHWTADGLPRLDTVKMLASDQTLTRDSVSAAAPGFTRTSPLPAEVPPAPPAPVVDSVPQAPEPPVQVEDGAGQGDSAGEIPAAPQPAANADPVPSVSNGETEQSEVDGGSGSATDEVEALEAELATQERYVAQIRAALVEGQDVLKAEVAKEDGLRAKLDALRPADDEPAAIQQYLAAQRKKLEERGARQDLIRESGIDLKALARDLRSPLDAAMARKSDRGSKRPGA
jgi:uncharacterized coiled-coil protein SlyX